MMVYGQVRATRGVCHVIGACKVGSKSHYRHVHGLVYVTFGACKVGCMPRYQCGVCRGSVRLRPACSNTKQPTVVPCKVMLM
eukprot:386383-Rhodomonas_salina.1